MENKRATSEHISHEESANFSSGNDYASSQGPRKGPSQGRGWFFKLCRALVRMVRYFWSRINKYLSPAFFLILGFSLLLWYSFELQDQYTTEIPVKFDIEGTKLRTGVVIHGTGYNIVKQRYNSRKEIPLLWKDLNRKFMVVGREPDTVAIQSKALQDIIAERHPDMAIDSMGMVPEVVRLPPEEEEVK